MNVNCNDLERILRDARPEELAALEAHAATCAECREELAVWHEISAAASGMQRSWKSPHLWPSIRRALEQESRVPQKRSWREWLVPAWTPAASWQMAAAALVLVVFSGVSVMVLWQAVPEPPENVSLQQLQEREQQRLLTEQALRDVESAEAEYMRKIDRLAEIAAPKLEKTDLPLLVSYREKLIVLDAAIADIRAYVEQNRFNAHLRTELLSIYQQKQKTLEAVMREAELR
jgi:hypothetical protein